MVQPDIPRRRNQNMVSNLLGQLEHRMEQLTHDTAEHRQQLDSDKTQFGSDTADLAKEGQQSALHRDRLEHGRRLLRQQHRQMRQQEQSLQPLHPQYQGVLKHCTMLIEVAQFLSAGEARIVRRWAASVATLVAICLVLSSGLSFVLGHDLTEPIWPTTTVLAFDVSNSDENLVGLTWVAHQRGILLSDAVAPEAIS